MQGSENEGHGERRGLFLQQNAPIRCDSAKLEGAKIWRLRRLFGGDGLNAGEAAAISAVSKLHAARNLGEERIVGADAHIGAGLDAGAALAGNYGAAGDQLTAKCLYAKPLRV
jgi:class 3 adenylate cyclase